MAVVTQASFLTSAVAATGTGTRRSPSPLPIKMAEVKRTKSDVVAEAELHTEENVRNHILLGIQYKSCLIFQEHSFTSPLFLQERPANSAEEVAKNDTCVNNGNNSAEADKIETASLESPGLQFKLDAASSK